MKATRTKTWTRRSASPARHAACASVQRQVCARKPRAGLRRAPPGPAARSFDTGEQPVRGLSRCATRLPAASLCAPVLASATKAWPRTSSAWPSPRRPGVNRLRRFNITTPSAKCAQSLRSRFAWCAHRSTSFRALRVRRRDGYVLRPRPSLAARAARATLGNGKSVCSCAAHTSTPTYVPPPARKPRSRAPCSHPPPQAGAPLSCAVSG